VARKTTDYIVLHCSATRAEQNIGKAEIDRWHRAKGWLMIGYHFVIRRDGMIEAGRPLYDPGAHVNPPVGINSRSVGICMVGGVDKDNKPQNNFTEAQWTALKTLVADMRRKFPKATVVGHGELAAKAGAPRACPSFNVQKWVKNPAGHGK
jgi:N-acetylmuramoyl-L-alanine amidase